MEVLLAVLAFVAIVAIVGIVRTNDDAGAPAWPDEPRRLPEPSPRDRYAITGMLGRAPVPSWG